MLSSAPTIKAIRVRAVIVPLKRPVRTAVGSIPAAPLVLIDVEPGSQDPSCFDDAPGKRPGM